MINSEKLEKENEERYLKELEERPPVYIDELKLRPAEVVFSKLSEAERFQVLTRYLNDLCAFSKSQLQIIADQYVLIEFLCKKLGVDVKKEKQELAKKYKEQMEENIKKSKEEIKKVSKA